MVALNGPIAVDCNPAHMAAVPLVVIEGEVLHASIVPECHGSLCLPEAACDLFAGSVCEQITQEGQAVFTGHVFEFFSESNVDVKRLAAGFWMGTHNGMFKSRVVVGGVFYFHR